MTDGDEEMKESIIESFLDEFPKLFSELKDTLKTGNIREISKICHKIRSPISMFGMKELLADITFIEKFTKDIDTNLFKIELNFNNTIDKIETMYKEIKNLI